MSTRLLGSQGEDLACEFLKKQGYKIVDRNFRIRGGEIDIVSKDPQNDLVFVEVKTRSSHEYGDPAESITPWKVRTLIKSVQFYLAKNQLINSSYRIDVITIDLVGGMKIEHFKNITL